MVRSLSMIVSVHTILDRVCYISTARQKIDFDR